MGSDIERYFQPPVIVRKTAAESVLNSTTLQNDDHLIFPVGPNEIWVVQYLLSAAFAAAGQIKVALTGPAGSTIRLSATMAANGIVPASGVTTTLGAAIPLVAALATSGEITLNATIVNGATAGNVTLQWAQNAVDAVTTDLLVNSVLIATKVA